MRDMDPALIRLDRGRARAVLRLRDRMVLSEACHLLLVDHRMRDIVAESEADASAASRLDEIIHGSRIERILSVYKFGMQDNVSLLGRAQGRQIIQSLPML